MAERRLPEDTEDTLHIEADYNYTYTIQDLLEKIQAKWPGITLEQIRIGALKKTTSGCGCHLDWDDIEAFLTIERIK